MWEEASWKLKRGEKGSASVWRNHRDEGKAGSAMQLVYRKAFLLEILADGQLSCGPDLKEETDSLLETFIEFPVSFQ